MAVRDLLGRAYRAVLRWPAQSALRRMLNGGVPSNLEMPLAYLVHPVLPAFDRRALAPIERIRAALAQRDSEPPMGFESPPPRLAGEPASPVPGRLKAYSWPQLMVETSVTPYWGAFLYLCAKNTRARTVLELGGCIGMSACYLSAGDSSRKVITVEGSASMAAIAEPNLSAINPNARVLNAMFDEALDRLLPELSGKLDLVHIDGQHERLSTLHYFERLKPHLPVGALVIFDDIHWNDDMNLVWSELSQIPGVAHAIDVGRYGLCLWKGGQSTPRSHDFSRYARHWRNQNRT